MKQLHEKNLMDEIVYIGLFVFNTTAVFKFAIILTIILKINIKNL